MRLRTTVLFAPGDSERKLEKALASLASAVVLDLEDSVGEASKPAARTTVAEVLAATTTNTERVVRVNRTDDGQWDTDDVAFIAQLADNGLVDGVMLPKVESPDDLDAFNDGIAGHRVPLWPVASETSRGVVNLERIASHPSVVALCWGAEDLSVSIGAWSPRVPTGELRPVFESVRFRALFASKAAGIDVLDTVYVDVRDEEGLRREARDAAEIGFSGKMAIHPDQLAVIDESFRPPRELVERSQRLLAMRADNEGAGTFRFEGQMVDRPHFRLAEQIIARDRAFGAR